VESTQARFRNCPICDERRGQVLHRQRFAVPEGYLLADAYDVVCCGRCGFVYADTPNSQADYDAYYERLSKYADRQTGTGGGDTPWDAARLDDTAECLVDYFEPQARLIEIGCSNGGLLAALRRRGFRHLLGIDPAPACVENTLARDVNARVGTLSALPPDPGRFDGIILSHVLEHVRDLQPALAAVVGLLETNGAVYIEVPDATRYAECVTAPFQDFNTEHINHFSPATLARLAARHGLAPVGHGHKVLQAPPPIPYPALFGVFRKSATPVEPEESRDTNLKERIEDYIVQSKAGMKRIDGRLRAALPADRRVILWGAGQLSMKLLAETALAEADVVAIVDSNPIHRGHRLKGATVVTPEEIRGRTEPIVIGTTLHQREIARCVRERWQLPNALITLGEA
jgi:SAM-dependent methyltransferase